MCLVPVIRLLEVTGNSDVSFGENLDHLVDVSRVIRLLLEGELANLRKNVLKLGCHLGAHLVCGDGFLDFSCGNECSVYTGLYLYTQGIIKGCALPYLTSRSIQSLGLGYSSSMASQGRVPVWSKTFEVSVC